MKECRRCFCLFTPIDRVFYPSTLWYCVKCCKEFQNNKWKFGGRTNMPFGDVIVENG